MAILSSIPIATLLAIIILGTVYYSLDASVTTDSFSNPLHKLHSSSDPRSQDGGYDQMYMHNSTSSGHSSHRYSDGALENVRNATLGFGKIFVASMKTRTDRRDALALAGVGCGMDITFVDGVKADEVPEKALPPLKGHALKDGLKPGTIGAWRTHANILREIVQSGIGSALIFEEDADWDVRIKDQLEQIALASRALTQPLDHETSTNQSGSSITTDAYGERIEPKYADPTYPSAELDVRVEPMTLGSLPKTQQPTKSPYGDNWDMLHLGHFQMTSPYYPPPKVDQSIFRYIPKGHVMIENDETVPEPHHIRHIDEIWHPSFKQYHEGVNHTRVVHHSAQFLGTHGFAISQAGARRLLHYVGVRAMDTDYDKMVANFCEDPGMRKKRQACLGVQPALFAQYRAPGSINKDSDIVNINAPAEAQREKGSDLNIRWSAMENMEKLINGQTDYEDQYPDTVVKETHETTKESMGENTSAMSETVQNESAVEQAVPAVPM